MPDEKVKRNDGYVRHNFTSKALNPTFDALRFVAVVGRVNELCLLNIQGNRVNFCRHV